jgi:leucyl aminopeptidase (aminopeptidase T)
MPERKKCLEAFIALLDQLKNREFTKDELSFIFRDGRVLKISLKKEEVAKKRLKLVKKEGKD